MDTTVPDCQRRADAAAVTTLLNCYLREQVGGEPPPAADGVLTVRLERLGLDLLAPLRYHSATGFHAYRPPVLLAGGNGAEPVTLDHLTLAALLGTELAATRGSRAELGAFVSAAADSTANLARFLAAGRHGVALTAPTPFLAAEQSLVLGHPLHPTPKSRQPMNPEEVARYAPELGAAFPLHWFRADRSVVAQDSALPQPATTLLAGLLADDPDTDPALASAARRPEFAYLPAHPWQAERLMQQPAVQQLLDAGLLEHLGPQGRPWHPTSSIRTVYRPDAAYMLKLSLAVRITNSVRVSLPKELARGVEVHRLLEAGLGGELTARFPWFSIVRDPAWACLHHPSGPVQPGFEVVMRENPYPAGCDRQATLVAALCQPGPDDSPPPLTLAVRAAAAAGSRPVAAVSRDWFRRYLDVAVGPLLWLYAVWGVALEAHQQNSIVELEDGWPAGFRYRDNQGYYFKASYADRLRALLPSLNAASDTVCDDRVADERLGYYLFVNHLLGLIGAFGLAGLAEERHLLADLAAYLDAAAARFDPAPPLIETLLAAERLPVKGNLLTRLYDMDELVGPMASQSVYVEVANPLVRASSGRPA